VSTDTSDTTPPEPAQPPQTLVLPTFRTNVDIDGRPLELWAVVALFAAPGIYLLQASLRALPDAFRYLTASYSLHALAFVLLMLIVLVGALGAGLVAIGWLLQRGDRVGRGLAYVAVGSFTGMVIFGSNATNGQVIAMLVGLAAVAVLAFAPAVVEVFTGPDAPQRDQPTSIVVARVALMIWLILLAVAAILDFCLADYQGKFAAYGIFLALIALGGWRMYHQLTIPDSRARLLVTAGAAVALLFLLLGWHDTGFALLFGLTVTIPICLWVPTDARAFYGQGPLITATSAAAAAPVAEPTAPSVATTIAESARTTAPGPPSAPEPVAATASTCGACGAELHRDDRFCRSCGAAAG